jgi:shikimate kinase
MRARRAILGVGEARGAGAVDGFTELHCRRFQVLREAHDWARQWWRTTARAGSCMAFGRYAQDFHVRMETSNNFPTGVGLASSASGFCA